jgi:uncharacterized iron-regulated protein
VRGLPGRVALFAALVCLLATACGSGERDILRVQDGTDVSFEEMASDLASVPLVFIGELHSSGRHHAAQLRIIRELTKRGIKVAVGLEMFHDGHQEELDRWLKGETETDDFLNTWYHNWNLPWALYREIFLFARESDLPMVGLNASPDLTSQVASRGFDSLTPEQLGRLPGVSCTIDPAYEDFIRRALGDHAHGEGSFRNFCEAQMVWDTAMARKVVDYLGKNEGAAMVVLAGSGHSWKHGIPRQVQLLAPLPFRTVLPETEGRPSKQDVLPGDTDYLWTGL